MFDDGPSYRGQASGVFGIPEAELHETMRVSAAIAVAHNCSLAPVLQGGSFYSVTVIYMLVMRWSVS